MRNKYTNIVEALEGVPRAAYTEFSDEDLDAVEVQLRHSLPDDYREFLQLYGNYRFHNPTFPMFGESAGARGSIFVFYGVGPKEASVADRYFGAIKYDDDIPAHAYPGISLFRVVNEEVEEITWPPELLPIGCDMGGNQICLALFGLRPGAVFFWVNAPGQGEQNVYLVANSFDEFIHSLQKSD